MPKNTLLAVFAPIMLLVMLSCCDNAHAKGASKKTVPSSSAPQPIRATLTLKPIRPSFFADEPVILNATVKNISDSSMSVLITAPADAYEITVVQHPGKEAQKSLYYNDLTARHGLLSIRIQFLKPGEQYTERINLSRLHDLTLSGKYKVKMTWKVSFAQDASTVDHLVASTEFFVDDGNQPIMKQK